MLQETIKRILLDFQEAPAALSVARHVKIESVRGKAAICIGVRRSGKSTCMYQIIQRLLDEGVSSQNILYLNFFDDRLHHLRHEDLSQITDAYFSIYPHKKTVETVYCFFDEIQVIPGWESFIDRLLRTENCEIYLTGSSARMLSREIATQMRGRSLSWEIFPFSFCEFLDSRNLESSGNLSSRKQLLIQNAFEEYWITGGFPEVAAQPLPPFASHSDTNSIPKPAKFAAMPERLRVATHQEYFQTVLFRDLVERHDISHPKALSELVHRLVDNTASLYSINKLTEYLKSLGYKVPKARVADYLQWLEDAYFLFSITIMDASLARRNTNPKKIYCIDHAMVRSISSGILINSGHLLENLVYVALRRAYRQIYYYRTNRGREIDFAVVKPDRGRMLIQVCESLKNEKTCNREIDALAEAMSELKLNSARIITRNEHQNFQVESGSIDAIPAWRFLLDLPENSL